MLPICYLFFMSLSAGVALLQPTLLSATDELVKPEESSLEAAQEAAATPPADLLKEQEKKEKKEPKEQRQVTPQPAVESGFGYAVTNGIGNLVKIIDVGVIGFFLLYWTAGFLREHVSENLFDPSGDEDSALWYSSATWMAVSALLALVAKSFFYFVKGYAWFKARATLFMTLLQLLLIVLFIGILRLFAHEGKFFSRDTVNLFSWMFSSHLLTLLLDLSIGSILQRSTRNSSLFG